MLLKPPEDIPGLTPEEKIVNGVHEVLELDYLMGRPLHDPASYFSRLHLMGVVAAHCGMTDAEVGKFDIIVRAEMNSFEAFMGSVLDL